MWATSRGRAALAAAQSPFADPALNLKALAEEAAPVEEEEAELDWPVTAQDLEFFKAHLDEEPGAATEPPGAGRWEKMLRKEWPACTYTAWRRSLPVSWCWLGAGSRGALRQLLGRLGSLGIRPSAGFC